MIIHGLILVIITAIPMTMLSFYLNDWFRTVVTSGASVFLWLAAAAGAPQMSYPYTKIFENTVDNSYKIIEGIHQTSGAVSWLSWVWMGMAIIMVIYIFASVSQRGSEELKKGMRR